MSTVIERCGGDFQPYLTDMTSILRQTIVDPYPEIKKVSPHSSSLYCVPLICSTMFNVFNAGELCLCQQACRSNTGGFSPAKWEFGQTSANIYDTPALQSTNCSPQGKNFSSWSISLSSYWFWWMYKHCKPMCNTVKPCAFFIMQAFGTIVQFGSATPINDALPSLAQRLCDSNPSVRLCLISVVGSWLLDLTDRSKKRMECKFRACKTLCLSVCLSLSLSLPPSLIPFKQVLILSQTYSSSADWAFWWRCQHQTYCSWTVGKGACLPGPLSSFRYLLPLPPPFFCPFQFVHLYRSALSMSWRMRKT